MMKLLLVEDDAVLAASIQEALTDAGHVVVGPCGRMRDALKLAATDRPDLALVDIGLEKAQDGVMLARMLALEFDVPSLFLSGSRVHAEANTDIAAGMLIKPFSPAAVVRAVEALAPPAPGRPPPPPPRELEFMRGVRPSR